VRLLVLIAQVPNAAPFGAVQHNKIHKKMFFSVIKTNEALQPNYQHLMDDVLSDFNKNNHYLG